MACANSKASFSSFVCYLLAGFLILIKPLISVVIDFRHCFFNIWYVRNKQHCVYTLVLKNKALFCTSQHIWQWHLQQCRATM